MKGLAPDLEIAYNFGVQSRYTQGLAAANSWNALGVEPTDPMRARAHGVESPGPGVSLGSGRPTPLNIAV